MIGLGENETNTLDEEIGGGGENLQRPWIRSHVVRDIDLATRGLGDDVGLPGVAVAEAGQFKLADQEGLRADIADGASGDDKIQLVPLGGVAIGGHGGAPQAGSFRHLRQRG